MKLEKKFVRACPKPKLENYESEDHRLQYYRIKKYAKILFHRHFKVLCINARGLRKISVRANVPGERNLITVIYSGLLIFRAVAEPRISSKSAKSREIHKNTRNALEILPNTVHVGTTYLKVILAVEAAYLL